MARGQDDSADGDEGRVLSPDELDISDDEHVAELGEGRYVVSPNEPIGDVPGHQQSETTKDPPEANANATDSRDASNSSAAEPPAPTDASNRGPDSELRSEPELTESDIREWQADRFAETDSRYGFDVTATFDGSIEHREMFSNDVVTIFESLVLWYAQQIDSKTPVEEVLGILLMEANVPIRYPSAGLQQLVESTGLNPDDTIADLVEAVDDDGFRL